ncbi:hypothetical protein [Acinetobacter venetianus]|uniref:hypothetical protein n=1 Tax=Acinetobacter venetianus TaxID=52133 RepID=UPI00214F9283|nr:hypothetical protein [Acinetobacter venetianus]MCR4529871.1 hypothetical protein [Acinetobacter venetianus]
MATYKIAHIHEQGQDIIIAPLESNFHHSSNEEQNQLIDYLQACATNAGLAGTVVPAWQFGGRVHFIAPVPWHPFFKSLSWNDILVNINKELTCG